MDDIVNYNNLISVYWYSVEQYIYLIIEPMSMVDWDSFIDESDIFGVLYFNDKVDVTIHKTIRYQYQVATDGTHAFQNKRLYIVAKPTTWPRICHLVCLTAWMKHNNNIVIFLWCNTLVNSVQWKQYEH